MQRLTRIGANSLMPLISPVLLLAAWQWATDARLFPSQILVAPTQVIEAAHALWQDGELQIHLQQSLFRLFAGFLIGAPVGIAAGIVVALSALARQLCEPLLDALRQVPTVAFIPLLVLLFGVEETFKILIVAKAAFFPVWLSTFDAVKGLPRRHMEVAAVLKLPLRVLIPRVVLPATVPPVLTGLRLSLGRSWMVLVAAELLAADSGVGQMMEMGRQMFRIDIVMVGVVLTGLIGFALDQLFRQIEVRLVRWRQL